jgi:hypothetical protein
VQFDYIAAQLENKCNKRFSNTTISAGLILLLDRGDISHKILVEKIEYVITTAGKRKLSDPFR